MHLHSLWIHPLVYVTTLFKTLQNLWGSKQSFLGQLHLDSLFLLLSGSVAMALFVSSGEQCVLMLQDSINAAWNNLLSLPTLLLLFLHISVESSLSQGNCSCSLSNYLPCYMLLQCHVLLTVTVLNLLVRLLDYVPIIMEILQSLGR